LEVSDDPSPDGVGLSNDDGICVMQRFIGQGGGMNSSKHHFDAAGTVPGCNVIGTAGRLAVDANPYEVHLFYVTIEIEGLDDVVSVNDFDVWWRLRGQDAEAQPWQ